MKTRTDTERRKRQASKTARVMAVASILDTIYRDIGVIRMAREKLLDYASRVSVLQDKRERPENEA